MSGLTWHPGWQRAVLADPKVQRDVSERVARVVVDARVRAPKETGAGAASIHAERIVRGGVTSWGVGWEPEFAYMEFHEFGTSKIPARPFLRSAVLAAGLTY